MRVLFSGVPAYGHLIPLLPLARAFRARGDEVALMVPASLAHLAADEGLEALIAGAESQDVIAEVGRRTGVDVRRSGDVDAVIEAFVTARLDLSADACADAAHRWRPDLVIHDPMDFVGPYLASVRDVPHAVHTFGADVSAGFIRASTDRATRDYAARGVGWREPRWVLDICPADLQVEGWEAPPGWQALRPEAHRAAVGVRPRTPEPLTGDPKVLMTFGTIFSDPSVLNPLLRGLLAHGAGVRVTLGTTMSPGDFALDSDRVVFEDFLPYESLLDGVDVVLAHGGAGTNLGALAAGLPLVLLPQGADQGGQAERVAAAGAAVVVTSDPADPAEVARTVVEVATSPPYRESARRIARRIAAMPTPGEVADRLADTWAAERA
ncbi:glycosyltransferase [Streptomyces liangshanensis]|uniref:Glycosyltransferase family 1 protein n=1 Tax=Streptomyces liangshanensis TaxID=2717324 RepID=A0A6G9GW98_9ACTN|nr:glycosyltransferase [Streptomyces liangshanensis]QIQ02197.1 glycosyltransferase family 1 protein [Streptomyces liangshanensis]